MDVAFELSDTEVIKEMVAHGLGVSILPASTFPPGCQRPDLRTIPVGGKDLYRKLALIYPSAKRQSAAAKELAGHLIRHFAAVVSSA